MPAPVADATAVQEIAYAGLDAVRSAVPLDLCAYLHAVSGMGPQLYLRTPDLSAMDAAQAFDLFSALRDALTAAEPGDRTVRLAGYEAVALCTVGPASQGLFVVGRRGVALGTGERELAVNVCAAVAMACHAVETSTVRRAVTWAPVRVAAEVADHAAHADVSIGAGDEVRDGRGEAATTTVAVALATLDALGRDLKLGDVADGEVAGERVMIALVHDGEGRTEVAAALGGNDPLQAAAVAVLDAAARLDA